MKLFVEHRAVLAQKFLGALPHQPFITESIFSVLRKEKKYDLHTGLHLKSIISRVANSVIGLFWLDPETCKNEAQRA